VALATLVGVAGVLAARALPRFLAVDDPKGQGILVVEGWLPRDALRLAAETYAHGEYDALVVSGGPVGDRAWEGGFPTYAERGAAELRRLGVVEPALSVVPAPASAQDRTYRSAVAVRQWIESRGKAVVTVDVMTYGPHARRSRALYRLALGSSIAVGSRAAPPSDYDLARWWRSSVGAKAVIGETIGYAWTLCCFWPGPRGSHEELWGERPQP
jgi:hypothetical protein